NIKVSTVNQKGNYLPEDTIEINIINQTKDSVRYYFGLECLYENNWSEIDNDIFKEEPKENYFFGLKSKSEFIHKIPISTLDIDSNFINLNYRIIVKTLPINSFIYQTYYLKPFGISNCNQKTMSFDKQKLIHEIHSSKFGIIYYTFILLSVTRLLSTIKNELFYKFTDTVNVIIRNNSKDSIRYY